MSLQCDLCFSVLCTLPGADLGMLKLGGGGHIVWVVYKWRDQTRHAQLQIDHTRTGTRPQERSGLGRVSLTDCAQCMQMTSIDMDLDYDSTVMLSCKLRTICHN